MNGMRLKSLLAGTKAVRLTYAFIVMTAFCLFKCISKKLKEKRYEYRNYL